MVPAFVARLIILTLGYLYPAFNSYKAIRDKNTREYVKWMMYWVVFALFTFVENFADIFVAFWCPFYQELKILTVIWFLAPATRGSSYLYRHFVHPFFTERAAEIDNYLGRVHHQGIVLVVNVSSRLVTSISASLIDAALKIAPQLAFGAAQLHNQINLNNNQPRVARSVLTASSSSVGRQRDREPEGHGDEGDGNSRRNQLSAISELSDADDNEPSRVPSTSAPAAIEVDESKTRKRRQPQARKRPSRVKLEEPMISEDDSDGPGGTRAREDDERVTGEDIQLQDEDIVELARSESVNSFEREFFPREMLPSVSEDDLPNKVKKKTTTRTAGVAKSVPSVPAAAGTKSRRQVGVKQSRRP